MCENKRIYGFEQSCRLLVWPGLVYEYEYAFDMSVAFIFFLCLLFIENEIAFAPCT